MEARKIETSRLLSLYGSLLTLKQAEILGLYIDEDWSLSEIAAYTGSSRQAVNDLIRRTERRLEELEDALGLMAIYERMQASVAQMLPYVERSEHSGEMLKQIECMQSIWEEKHGL